MVVLVPGLIILILVSSQTGFSVHSRYVIPTLPFLFIWTSKAARVLEAGPNALPFTKRTWGIVGWFCNRKQPVMALLVILALTWSVGSSLSIYPHSLSYFNELAAVLPTSADASYPKAIGEDRGTQSIISKINWAINAGPRNGPRHLLDSNIDWGQDLFYLKDWLGLHPDVKLDGLAYWNSYPAPLAGILETPPPARGLCDGDLPTAWDPDRFGPLPGWYALSVNYIYSRARQYRYFLNFEPVAMAGYSIYIYHITIDEANRVRRKLGLPELKAGPQTENPRGE